MKKSAKAVHGLTPSVMRDQYKGRIQLALVFLSQHEAHGNTVEAERMAKIVQKYACLALLWGAIAKEGGYE